MIIVVDIPATLVDSLRDKLWNAAPGDPDTLSDVVAACIECAIFEGDLYAFNRDWHGPITFERWQQIHEINGTIFTAGYDRQLAKMLKPLPGLQ